MGTKINQLLQLWKPGLILTSSFLQRNGFSRTLQDSYLRSGWLESIGAGAYKRTGDSVQWQGGLQALQVQLEIPVHIGSKSALINHGLGHYAYGGREIIHLFAKPGIKLPAWFEGHSWTVTFDVSRTKILPYELAQSFSQKSLDGFNIRMASAERAFLENMYLIPQRQGFDETLKMLESAVALRPDLMQTLLEHCSSIKVKRLFLYMAEQVNHPWLTKIDLSRINLGHGKRVVIPDGRLDKKYQITVPR